MAEQPQDEVAKSGCFSRFFRLLLCAHSTNAPPIHPSDHLPPPQTPPSLPNKPNPVPTTPSLVARLMGLESLPNTSRVSNRVLPDSVPRSKSFNFIDYLLQLDPTHQDRQEASHRRFRTSSFREVPVLSSPFRQEKNDGDVVVFLWDDVDAAARESRRDDVVGQSLKKQEEVGSLKELKKQRKEKKKKKISKLKNEPRTRVSVSTSTRNYGDGSFMSPRMRKEEFVEPRFKRKVRSNRSSLKKMKNKSCSENLSPVSVLDVGEDQGFPLKNKTNFTDETKGMASKSKRESSADERGGKSNIHHKSETEECSELMAKVRKLAENDVQQMFDSVGRKGVFGSDHCFEEIPLVLEHKIFDLLLREVVHELLTL
ncbi:hypothetical protein QN277_025220 [Acacia crassicarpa]|uniref:DUF3741 domain-containing protein n=1 Tax=Acacia crassicarpa TaxID=499986 RepID=A0AAE1JDT4_9FABA|nr:hypothetical protein QN277_025220 [Acacia crassicarpa]